ncbi:MAG: DUF4406 domain-containing protein [Phycisphaerae bacterium]
MSETKRIYVSGPMTGREALNFPAFHAAAERFAEAGWRVSNPALNFGGRTDLPREVYLRADVSMLAKCDAIALLPGWQRSRGATLEAVLAAELGLRFFDAETGAEMPAPPRVAWTVEEGGDSVLDVAQRITAGARHSDYGPPSEDFARTAALWTAILERRLRDGEAVTAMDVPLCMIALKLARQVHRHKRDNLVDIAGYARTAAMVAGEE